MLALALVISVVAAVSPFAGGPHAASAVGGDPGLHPKATGPGGVLPQFQAAGSNLVRLQAGAFDPLQSTGPVQTAIPAVSVAALSPTATYPWLVQVLDQQFAAAQSDIAGAGATVVDYLPDNTYVVYATVAQRTTLAASPAVRWSGYLQPAWRVPVAEAGLPALTAVTGTQDYRVYAFRHFSGSGALAADLAAIPGVSVVRHAVVVADVRATAAELPLIAALPEVAWVTARPQLVTLNENARWVIDTGVRDLFRATSPNGEAPARLSGAGQTAGDADTALNYIPDANQRFGAHEAFGDCADPGTNLDCKEADYTQQNAGDTTGDMTTVVDHNTNHRKMAAFFDVGGNGAVPCDGDAHGTHTAGSVTADAGTRGQWDNHDGLAPAARLVFSGICTPDGGLDTGSDYYDLFRQAYRPRDPGSVANNTLTVPPPAADPADYHENYHSLEDARTHNNSYGATFAIADPFGEAVTVDQFVWDHEDMNIDVAAGNAGPDVGTIASPGVAKNDFNSAASSNGRQPMSAIDSITNFSSHGPTGDGRYGITVATPGEIVVGPKGGTVDQYQYLQGTSMSTPVLTGALTLMRQYFYDGFGPAGGKGFPGGAPNAANQWNPSSALIKASAVAGAVRMRGWYTGDDGGNAEAQLRGQYPSGGQGFGLLNLDNSLYFANDPANAWYHDVYRGDAEAFGLADQGGSRTYTVHVEGDQPLNVALAWTDAPDALPAGSPALVNDLDLTLTAPDGTTSYVGNNFNTRTNPSAADAEVTSGPAAPDDVNNIEKVRVAHPAAGDWTITVHATRIAMESQGFALAANGDLSDPGQPGFAAGPALQADAAGSPTIANLTTTPVSADTVQVSFDTSEPTTATATGTVAADAHTFTDVYELDATTKWYGIPSGPVEDSPTYAGKPVLSTHHEIVLTGFPAGATRTFKLAVQDVGGSPPVTATTTFTTPSNIFQPVKAADQAQLTASDTGAEWEIGKQFYAGHDPATPDDFLGTFMFRIPESLDPATVTGAHVELSTAHDLTSEFDQDPVYSLDLLDDSVKAGWGTQTYADIESAPTQARFAPETTLHPGANARLSFALPCAQLDRLKTSLAAVSGGQRLLPFRWDASQSGGAAQLFSAEFGFNRRSKGVQYRPLLVLDTTTSQATPPLSPCDPNAPAPVISKVGIHAGATPKTQTVTWRTDRDSDSLVLFREKGTTAWTQVGTPARTQFHQVQVVGIDPAKHYEFGVRSTGCNGASSTDDNAGAGYDFTFPPPVPPPPPPPGTTYTFHGTASDDANRIAGTPTATFDTNPPAGTDRTQTGDVFLADPTIAGDAGSVSWFAPYTGTVDGDVVLDWFWSTSNPEALLLGDSVDISIFADADPAAGTGTLIGSASTVGVAVDTSPVESVSVVKGVHGTAATNLLIQASPHYSDSSHSLTVHYDGADTGSTVFLPTAQPAAVTPTGPVVGPIPAPTAGASGLGLAAVPTDATPTAADLAAGTALCDVPGLPTAALSATPSGAAAPATITLDSSASTADGAIASRAFDPGDGTGVITTTAATVTHVYQTAGAYTATVTVYDSAGQSASASVPVDARTGPVAALAASPKTVQAGDPVSFDAGGSTPGASGSGAPATLVRFDWNFGDGTLATTSAPTTSHVYVHSGRYSPVVTVTNSYGDQSTSLASPVAVDVSASTGYWMAGADGGVFAFGEARYAGSLGGIKLNQPIVGMAATPSRQGYWLVSADGGVFAFGDAKFQGSLGGIKLNQPIIGMASSPSGRGYWLVARDGGVFAFGDARYLGSGAGQGLTSPVTGIAAAGGGRNGYWLVTASGRVLAFGVAPLGQVGGAPSAPIVGITATRHDGYWLEGADGAVFAYGDAAFAGSLIGIRHNGLVVGLAASGTDRGYWLGANDGGVFAFPDAGFQGSLGGMRLRAPIVAVSSAATG